MADEADRAADEEAAYLAEVMRKQRERSEAVALRLPEGMCLNCETDLPDLKGRFCDLDCSADWQARQETMRRLASRKKG